MNLSSSEKKFYEGVFSKLEQNNQALDENNCSKLIERGIDDPEVCKKIWELCSQSNSKKVLSKKEFFKMLKYIAAYQNGHQVSENILETLPELPRPHLPKKSGKESTTKGSEPSSTAESQVTTTKSSVQEKIESKENISNNSNNLMSTTAVNTGDQTKEKKLARPPSKPEDNFEEKKMAEKKEKLKEEKKAPERVLEELDSELVVPEQIKAVQIPNFDESVRMTDPASLVNPYKTDMSSTARVSEKKKNMFISGGTDLITEAPRNAREEDDDDDEEVIRTGPAMENSRAKVNGMGTYRGTANRAEYDKYLENIKRINVEITEAITHNSGFLGYGTYVTYSIRCTYTNGNGFQVERRYSDFDWLNSYLRSQTQYKGLVFPKLPEKKSIGATDPNFVHQRRIELEKYLKELGKHERLSQDPVLRIFLGDEERESLQSVKDKKPAPGIGSLTELDLHKMKEMYEYAVASVKIKWRKEDFNFDWKGSDEKINEILNLDETMNKLFKDLQKKEEAYRTMQTIGTNHGILHTKIMNRANDEAYFAIGTLSSLFGAKASHSFRELAIYEDLIKEVKTFMAKLDGFKESYSLLFSTLKEILTNKELNKNKHGKMFEIHAENNGNHMQQARKDIDEIGGKIVSLEKEAETIRDNLTYEMENIFTEFAIILPVVLHEFYSRQTGQLEKVVECWAANGSQLM